MCMQQACGCVCLCPRFGSCAHCLNPWRLKFVYMIFKNSIPTSQKMFRLCTAKGTNRCFMQELQETRIIIWGQNKESLNVIPYGDHWAFEDLVVSCVLASSLLETNLFCASHGRYGLFRAWRRISSVHNSGNVLRWSRTSGESIQKWVHVWLLLMGIYWA
jgi:hypothetical protein